MHLPASYVSIGLKEKEPSVEKAADGGKEEKMLTLERAMELNKDMVTQDHLILHSMLIFLNEFYFIFILY